VNIIDDLQAIASGQRPGTRRVDDIRRGVRTMLESAQSFQELPAEDRLKLARSMVEIIKYISDSGRPAGTVQAQGLAAPSEPPLATSLEDANSALKDNLAKKQNLVGKDFKAGAANEGAKVFKQLVQAVEFPKFVSNLIEGVYTSIVNSSIKQMNAYGKFLEAVVKSAQEFAAENISLDAARDFIAATHPNAVQVTRDGEGARLELRPDVEDKDQPDFKKSLGMAENVPLDEDNEVKIVMAAQLKMAQQRQQQLATMLLLGINRIVVTEGEIKASVLFDVKAHDTAQRDTSAGTSDENTSSSSTQSGGWFSDDTTKVDTSVSSAYSEVRDKSTADVEAKAKLSGSVTVKFKSETFPLERFASQVEMGSLQEKSAR
jgi:hypothetical protein